MVMAKSAPHIYLSALPFAPTSSCIAAEYSHRFPHIISVKLGKASHWPALEMVIQVNRDILSVALSPDGQYIVSGTFDSTICVWNAITGEIVAGPFTGHTGSVHSVAFSPSGQHIVSGSSDCTICVWHAITGERVAGPFTGHTDLVNSVAFSPDGQHIVSGSTDTTACVWNAATGKIVIGSFTGHTDSVNSVAFSPDGQYIVSGSSDNAICIWSVTTGEAITGPLTGHTDSVKSVAFSPDGQHIVSGSFDYTICMWDITKVKSEPRVTFTDQSVISIDGWISAASGELLIWIPGQHRRCLHHPSNIWIAGRNETSLDLSQFVHGKNWSNCYLPI